MSDSLFAEPRRLKPPPPRRKQWAQGVVGTIRSATPTNADVSPVGSVVLIGDTPPECDDSDLAMFFASHPQALAEVLYFDNPRIAELQAEAWELAARYDLERYVETSAMITEMIISSEKHSQALDAMKRRIGALVSVRQKVRG